MSFNEIAEFRTALGVISRDYPKLINAGQRSLLWVIVSYPEGCFIGLDELANQAGLSNDTTKAYLRALTKLSLIDREQSYARKGLRQCYRVNVSALTNFVRVLPDTPFNNSVMGVTNTAKGVTKLANGSHPIHPYKEYKDYKYDKERFDKLITYLPKDVRQYVKPGKNYEERLDELERRGITLEAVGVYLSKQNFATSHKIGGLISSFLDELLGVKPKGVSSSMPSWCGGDYCDKATRLWPEASYDKSGHLTNKCLKCHPDYFGK
jgi:hypothetical protein